MRGATGAGDNHLKPGIGGGGGEIIESLRRAVRRDDFDFMGDFKAVEDFVGVFHRFPVRLGTHNDSHQRFRIGIRHREVIK